MELNRSKLFFLIVGLFYLSEAKNPQQGKQLGVGTGITFAIPALNFLGGNNNNNGNIFGAKTTTRTIVSTVSTVTATSFRTCTTVAAALMPCAGRRKRSADWDENNEVDKEQESIRVEATPTIKLVIGTTTISNPVDVSQYLEAHKETPNSIIYPKDAESEIKGSFSSDVPEGTTLLYPSHDNSEQRFEAIAQDDLDFTTEASVDDDSTVDDSTPYSLLLNDPDNKARLGIGSTTTVTTVIRVTSVATVLGSGAMATLTVMYAGCSPSSFPVSGIAC